MLPHFHKQLIFSLLSRELEEVECKYPCLGEKYFLKTLNDFGGT